MSGTLPTVSLVVAKSYLTEGTDKTLDVIVVRTPSDLTSSVTVEFFTPVTTRNVAGADDFVGGLASKVVTFAPGETSKAVSWGLVDDNVPEVTGTIGLWLRNPINATVSMSNGGSTGVIIQDDDPISTLSISAVGASAVREGDASDQGAHKLTFDIVREGNTSWSISATVAIEADTTAGAHSASAGDIVGGFATQQIYFNPGETHKTFEVAIAGDSLLEGNETFVVRIANIWTPSSTPGFVTGIGTVAVTATILDDDTPVVSGGAGNDVLHHVDGPHIYDGGAGFDVLDYGATGRRGLAVTRSAEGDVVISHGGQTDTLRS
ncbi:Calx-beta domain-containing protein, partial [Roseomonas gilardii]